MDAVIWPLKWIAVVVAISASEAASAKPAPWADKGLPAIKGLELWFDASVQPAAARARKRNALHNGDAVEYGFDSSGHDRHLRQADTKAQPVFRSDGKLGSLRFNGRSSNLSLDGLGLTFDRMTTFLVLAPFRNEGNFRGILSMHADGEDDFRSGLNVDLGANPSAKFSVVNVEGAGTAGMQNLRMQDDAFSRFHRLCVVSDTAANNLALYVDGQAEGSRSRSSLPFHMDEVILGARSYGGGKFPRGFFAGEIAEVLVYNRRLSEQERAAVDKYLASKYDAAGPIPPLVEPPVPGSIARVASPPVVQMLVPRFTVRELPVKLTNINNILYREDGTLVALGYDGNIHLLTDTDGDGLEDKGELFYQNKGELIAPIGMSLTPPGYERGRGVLVAAKGKCTLILDTDGDNRADEEIVVAEGWPETPHPVDALGAAFDPHDHAIFFGLGTLDFRDPYVLKGGTKPGYHLSNERGTILRVAPDFESRKIFATGIRFPVAIRFNRQGDLFCTDQEGATWLANGNPFDELLNVQQGRHYGFPPRHPRYLPNVIDEPSAFDYRPQHQSTCGLNFNEPASDGSIFGPAWWRSDAFVSGYSRGKLYRTKLAKTAAGYVGQTQLLGSFTMLPVDACIAPGGSLLVSAHSGGPDWGSGPSGSGKLFKIAFEPSEVPFPSLVWPNGLQEVRIAFDEPVSPALLKGIASRLAVEGGEFVAAGNRLEIVRPGYAAVEHQQNSPRFPVDVENVQLTSDGRTMILSTVPNSAAVTYAIALRNVRPTHSSTATSHELPQLPDVDLQYDLTGVEVNWEPQTGDKLTGWLPHPDLDVSRTFTVASAWHDQFWREVVGPGELQLRTKVDLHSMLRPAVQPGETIDYKLPDERVALTFTSNSPFDLTLDGTSTSASRETGGRWSVEQTVVGSKRGTWPLEARLHCGPNAKPPTFTVSFHTQEDSHPRALPLHRFLVPWARTTGGAAPIPDNSTLPELAGGNWLRGRNEFFGADAACSKCHRIRGEGGAVGPDLSNLPKRDYASVVRDITQPSYAINPDYVAQIVVTNDGRTIIGMVRSDKDRIIVADQQAKEMTLSRDEIDEIHASNASLMPEGNPKLLGPDRFRDLLRFLLVDPPHMPMYGETSPPPPRTMRTVEAALANSERTATKRPVNIVLVAGPKDHGIGEHDYPNWQTTWKSLLQMDEAVHISTANPWPSADQLKSADVLVFYQDGSWTPDKARDIDAFLHRGGGLVYIHFAVDGGSDPSGFAKRIGLAWQTGKSKFRHGPLDLRFCQKKTHPIARNIKHLQLYDESYWELVGESNSESVKVLATGVEDGRPQPLMWTVEPDTGGRVFVSIPGHFAWTFDDPMFRLLLLRGIAWSAHQSVDRFNDLVLPGARVASDNH